MARLQKQIGNSRRSWLFAGVVVIAVVIGVGYFAGSKAEAPSIQTETTESQSSKELSDEREINETYAFVGALSDVTNAANIQNTQFTGAASGEAKIRSTDNFQLEVNFKNLPAPAGDSFYEGWVVRKGANQSVVSTGKATINDGQYTNKFTSDTNLQDHTFYVLTLEPNDGDPAPADHILEGTMLRVNN